MIYAQVAVYPELSLDDITYKAHDVSVGVINAPQRPTSVSRLREVDFQVNDLVAENWCVRPSRRSPMADLMPSLRTDWFVAIGASASEGLDDIKRLLGALPAGCPAIFMVVLHRPSDRKSELLEVLQRCCAMPVRIAQQAEDLQRGVCYIGEPAEHLTLMSHGRADMIAGQKNSYRNRSVDLLLGSIARFAPRRAIGLVLSGALNNGSRGLAQIHAAGA